MPISTPVAASGSRSPERARRIPQAVRSTVLQMIHEATDFITAAKANGLKPDTMRRWLHRPEVISLIRRERAAFRLAICSANEHVLAQIRDQRDGNQMARVRAVQVLEGIEDSSQVKPSSAPAPGVTVRIVNVVAPDAQATTIDVTPRAPQPAPAEPEPEIDPIFQIR
jgi:hypothetical protein